MESIFEFLRLIQSKDLFFWDVKTHSCKSISSQFVVIKLKDYLVEQNKKEKLFKYPDKYFKILGVNNQNGLFDAYEEQGKNINQPYKKVENGWFAYNPYRVNVGSIGLKSAQQNNEYISPAYVVFSCKEALLPDYLNIIIKTKFFNEAIKANTTGSVRQTLGFNNLCNIRIPLPSIERQKELVAQYNALLNLAKDRENQADAIEQSIDDYLMTELGIEDNLISTNKNLFQTVEYKNLSKWVLDASNSISSKYKIFSFDEVCSKITDGTHQTPEYVSQGTTFLSAKDVTSQELSLKNVKYIPEYLHNQLKARCLPQKDDILLAKNGTTGVAALFTLDYEVSIYVSLALLRCNLQLILPKFLLYYINSKFAKEQFDKGLIGVGVPNLHLSVIKNTLIPLPPLDVQNQIVEEITLRKEQIKNLREESEKLRLQAISNFEKEVFN